ncbi:MAG TPA: CAP domain-containing protein, partial [Bacillaceae bacterium]
FIGKPAAELINDFGQPQRKEPSLFGYEWWIYNQYNETYMQAGIEDGHIVTIYAMGHQLNVSPFKIGQTIEEIFRTTLLETEIMVKAERGTYRFELSEEDLNIRPLVQLGDIYAQLSIDKYTGTLSSIRLLNHKTLIIQHPYELVYRGELLTPPIPSEDGWRKMEEGAERQVFDITNIIRQRFSLPELEWDAQVAEVAYQHSKDMQENEYFAHESPAYGDLSNRLEAGDVEYQLAGENIASQYMDGPAAVEGWLNSEGHRKTLLEKEYSHLGVGVYTRYEDGMFQKNYTQNFIKHKESP